MRNVLGILSVFILAFIIHGCGDGGFTTDPGSDQNTGLGTTTTVGGPTTTVTGPTLPPPTTTVPPPPGGHICCSTFGGCFSTHQQIINYANATGNTNTCIQVSGQTIRGGFGPCISCTDPTATTTTTTTIPSTTTTKPPGTTTTTIPGPTTTGWPTTTQPGAG